MSKGSILVFNAGSSSIKFALFGRSGEALDARAVVSGSVTEIGGASRLHLSLRDVRSDIACHAPDHDAALAVCLLALETSGHSVETLAAAGHRVVHGRRDLVEPCLVTPAVLAGIEACVPLAPLHNPANLSAIRAVARRAPDLPQVVSFDTAFHATNPEVACRYAVPSAIDMAGIRRYGFHGISYAGLCQQLPGISGRPLPHRLLALHLGSGASLCAIQAGRSVATTMGYSPLEGLTMGTRSGGIDGNAVLRLAEVHGIDGAARILNEESGLLGLGGASDMRALAVAGTEAARFAIAHFCYWAVRHSGSMIAAMGGLDVIAFTGGIGENDAHVRGQIMDGLHWVGLVQDAAANASGAARLHASDSTVSAWIVPAQEEHRIAMETLACLDARNEVP